MTPSPGAAPAAPSSRVAPLTPREAEILAYLGTWMSLDEIGVELDITSNTVKSHVRSIYWKLGVHSRRQAGAWAAAHPGPVSG